MHKIKPSEITPESVFIKRREFLRLSGMAAIGTLSTACHADAPAARQAVLADIARSPLSTDKTPTSYEDVTTYNNFYEFGTSKSDPHENAGDFVPQPWKVSVAGECDKPGTYNYEDIIDPHPLEERIYRLRCVEAWSMVIPWVGFPLGDLLKRFEPNARARFVRFTTLYDPKQMPGQRWPVLEWPYVEGLTIAEAMHPLAIMAVGLYGKELPNQNGAPMRLVVPWKYGFKSIKSINRIEFLEHQPKNSWALATPREYGFYANVNPDVDHPRWSQAKERPIGTGLFASKQPTLMFNGYAEQVADLYSGLDLTRNF